MAVQSKYKNTFRNARLGQALPVISTELDSVRNYMFEVTFEGLPSDISGETDGLTLAAKQVESTGISVEDIEVRRLNDQIYFPGSVKNEELVITFDNLYLKKSAGTLWEWFRSIYDPLSGNATKYARPGGSLGTFKAMKLRVLELDNTRNPHAAIEFYGVYPRAVKFSEKNYSQSEFATINVTFRYDYMDYYNYN